MRPRSAIGHGHHGDPPIEPAPHWLAQVFAICAIVLVPWTVWLYLRLPARVTASHWDAAWAGFDVALSCLLLATAVGALRRAPWTQGVAAAAATLLLCDAWFDVLTAHTTRGFAVAMVMAVFVEVPLALVCVWVARNSERVSAWARARTERRAANAAAP
jgi:hypothetical protein